MQGGAFRGGSGWARADVTLSGVVGHCVMVNRFERGECRSNSAGALVSGVIGCRGFGSNTEFTVWSSLGIEAKALLFETSKE